LSKFDKKFLFLLFIFSFVLRMFFFLFIVKDNPVVWQFDSRVYKDVAQQIISGNGITNLNGTSHFYRVPGYSLFLAITSFGKDFNFSLFIQLILASFVPILIFFLSRQIFNKDKLLPYVVSLIASIHLGFVLFSGLVMTESLFTMFFLLFFMFFYKNKYFLAGLFLGLSSMFRPVGHYLIFISIFIIFVFYKNKINSSMKLFSAWFLVILPWVLRNFIFTGSLFFTTLPGIHFLKHSAARVYMQINKCSYIPALNTVTAEWQDLVLKEEARLNKKLNEPEICFLAEKLSFNYLLKDFKISFYHAFKNIFKTCFSLYSSELLFLDSTGKLPEYSNNRNFKSIINRFLFPELNNKFLILFIYFEILLFMLLLIGFIGFILNSFFYKKDQFILLQILPFILLFVFISFSCGFARLRLPIEPFLIVLSIEFWLKFIKKRKLIFYD
jgi:hypothetical protein